MNFLEKGEALVSPEQHKFEVKQQTQMEIMQMAGGSDIALDWINANGKRFDELFNDPQYNFYTRLSSKETHDEALEEIKNKLYN